LLIFHSSNNNKYKYLYLYLLKIGVFTMKIKANRNDLLKPLLLAGNVIERRQTLPILANVLISTSKENLKITATDLEVEMTTMSKAENSEDIEFTVPARKIIDICKALPENSNITLEVDGEKAVLKSGRGRYKMSILPARDYPSIEPSSVSQTIKMPEVSLKKLIDKTSFAMAHQDVRYYLNGLLLEIRSGRMRAVATDGHRLALSDVDFKLNDIEDLQIILPRKAIVELSRILSDSKNEIEIQISDSHLRVQSGNTSFISKLIDGKFPDYERVMPSSETIECRADKNYLKQALTRTSILSNEKYRGIRFRLNKNMLHLQAHNPEQDEAEEELEVEYEGKELTIGFNVGYLLDVLGVIDTDSVVLSVIDSNSSTLISPDKSLDSQYVIMPMRL